MVRGNTASPPLPLITWTMTMGSSMTAPGATSTTRGSTAKASLRRTKSRGSAMTEPSRDSMSSCSVARPRVRRSSSTDEATVASTPLMVTMRPERGPRLSTRVWMRSEGDGPGSLCGSTGTVPDGRKRSRSSVSIRLYRHTSSFSLGRTDEENASAAATRRRCNHGSPGRVAAVSLVKVDRMGASRARRPGLRASPPYYLPVSGPPTFAAGLRARRPARRSRGCGLRSGP